MVGFGVMMVLFVFWQSHQKDNASIPFRIFTQRSVYSAVATLFFGLGSVQYVCPADLLRQIADSQLTVVRLLGYYLPMWFQVIKDSSPVNSGVRMLPMILGNVLISVISGGLGKKLPLNYKCGQSIPEVSIVLATFKIASFNRNLSSSKSNIRALYLRHILILRLS